MGGRCRIDDLPVIAVEKCALLVGQSTLRIVDDQPRAERCEGSINVDGIGIAREIHRMNAVVSKMALQPIDAKKVSCEPVLHDQILAEA